jgi:hypothetical protein
VQELKVPDSSALDWGISRTQHSLNARRPLDEMGATIFFQLVSARYERGSIILTSNKSYGDWGSIFGDPIIATAIKGLTNVGFSGGRVGEFSTGELGKFQPALTRRPSLGSTAEGPWLGTVVQSASISSARTDEILLRCHPISVSDFTFTSASHH